MFPSGFAIASSTFEDNKLLHGPNLAIDGKYSNQKRGFYKSHSSDQNPWHMTVLRRPKYLAAVRIYNIRNDSKYPPNKPNKDMLRNVTVYAGTFKIEANFSDVSDLLDASVDNKTMCGSHLMPGEDGGIYTINCQERIKADVIIIQPTGSGKNESLKLDEVEFLREGAKL